MKDYSERKYLSSIEAAKYLSISVEQLHNALKKGEIVCKISTSGQKRFDIETLKVYGANRPKKQTKSSTPLLTNLNINNTKQTLILGDSKAMSDIEDNSMHLLVTSPPYFDAKMYSGEAISGDLGNIHDLKEWLAEIGKVWAEVFRVLQPGRKAFINIMNLPIRDKKSFRTLNLAGKTIDLMEKIGFVFKRDIIWHKTNGVKAHFGTYPYPGGILINNMHEFILEFNKPAPRDFPKYSHLTKKQKELSKLSKEFWLSIKNSDVWVMNPQNSGDSRKHVAPFPKELPSRLIKAFSYVGETVLDPFVGAGTTLQAAAELGRNGVGYEIVPEILEDAINTLKSVQN